MNLNEWRDEIHKVAKEHGWWDKERSFGDIIALCHSELSEALEEYRNDKPLLYYECSVDPRINDICVYKENEEHECPLSELAACGRCIFKHPKPEGIAIELADCIIRILDYCGYAGIDIEEAVRIKHKFNETRPYRHGNKTI